MEESQLSANLAEKSFMFAIPAYEGKLQVETAMSMLVLAGKLTQAGVRHCFNVVRGGALIDLARNEIAHRFLNETECDILVCIDADIEFTWESMERLLVFACHYPMVCGAYCSRTEPPKFIVNAIEEKPKLNQHGLIPVKGLGFGFVALQRKTLEAMKPYVDTYVDKAAEAKEVYQFYRTGEKNERREVIGEDVYFFKKAVEAGITPYLDPGITLIHHGSKAFNYQLKDYIDQLIGDSNGLQKN